MVPHDWGICNVHENQAIKEAIILEHWGKVGAHGGHGTAGMAMRIACTWHGIVQRVRCEGRQTRSLSLGGTVPSCPGPLEIVPAVRRMIFNCR